MPAPPSASPRPPPLCGVLVVDKPEGPTSAGVVAAVKKRLDQRRIGHTGTLDPMATGVLPLCLGPATKIATFLLAADKTYTGTIVLGVATDTLDADGTIISDARERARAVDESNVRRAMAALTGPIDQVPPMYSALRRDGKRLHELARAGQVVERSPRPVVVRAFTLTGYVPRDDRPEVHFEVCCSKGTYVRSLARDLGSALGCGAHLSALRRTQTGRFTIADAVPLEAIDRETVSEHLIAPAAAITHLPVVPVGQQLVARVCSGLQLRWEQLECAEEAPSGLFSLISPEGELLAVTRLEDGKLAYARVIQTLS